MPPRKKIKTEHVKDGAKITICHTTRSRGKAITAAVAANTSGTDQPPVASVASAVVKLRKGCLKEIPNFAVEIQLMIFGNLHPQDLFNLSRTSKTFHGFFLHRSNEALWEASEKNADDLPERPPWMSIPAFIHLLYSNHCHNCGCANIRKIIWPWFARYCSYCLPEVKIDGNDAAGRLLNAKCNISPGDVLDNIPTPNPVRLPYNCYSRSDYQYQQNRSKWYLGRQVNQLVAQWTALPEPRDSSALRAFYTQCRNDLQIWRKHTLQCKEWHDELEADRKINLREGRKDRFSEIVKRLIEAGWKDDLDFLGPQGLEKMSHLPVVRQSVKLTDKGWEKVQEAVHSLLTGARKERLKKERDALIKERFAELDKAIVAHCITIPRDATMECHPLPFDLALQPDLEPLANAPSSECITQETFAPVIPKLVANWEDEQRELLRSFLRRFITKEPSGVDILDLAIAMFYSNSSSEGEARRMRYPHVLTCWSLRYGGGFNPNHYAAPARPNSYSVPCNLKELEPELVEVGIRWMRTIVTKLGLNPDTATFAEMEQCDARLRCLACAELGEPQYAYTWEAAFAHTAKHKIIRSRNTYPRSSSHNRWRRIDEADVAKVKELEAAHALSADSKTYWSCALCVDWNGRGIANVREHLASEHNIEDPEGAIEDKNFFWSPRHNWQVKRPAVEF